MDIFAEPDGPFMQATLIEIDDHARLIDHDLRASQAFS
jgi:hypothetical protein